MFGARSGHDGAGAGHKVERNLCEDFRRDFGAEPGTITAMAMMTDIDNTGFPLSVWRPSTARSTGGSPRRT